jgi:putative FmdB family regulatory protein
MPTYEYACNACDERLEAVQSFRDDPLTTCPACGGGLRKVFGSIGVVFKGSGFYKTDSRSAAKASKGAKESTSTESSKESSGSKETSGSGNGSSSGGASGSSSGESSSSNKSKSSDKSKSPSVAAS